MGIPIYKRNAIFRYYTRYPIFTDSPPNSAMKPALISSLTSWDNIGYKGENGKYDKRPYLTDLTGWDKRIVPTIARFEKIKFVAMFARGS